MVMHITSQYIDNDELVYQIDLRKAIDIIKILIKMSLLLMIIYYSFHNLFHVQSTPKHFLTNINHKMKVNFLIV